MSLKPVRSGIAHLLILVLLVCLSPIAADPSADGMAELPSEVEANLVNPLAIEKTPTFTEGEQLKFRLGWGIFKVARSELTVAPDVYDDSPALKISIQTRTNGFADAFYKVRNFSTSWITDDVSWSWEYNAIQQEGKRDRDITARFDPEALTGRYINNREGTERDPVDILPGTFDPLGIVFFVRCLEFDVGDELVIPTSNGKEFFYTVVRVVDKVKKKFPTGRQEAWVLEPDIKDLGGVFKRSKGASLRFYLSADEHKRPLRMESEVAVGKFWAELVEVVD